MLVLKEGYTIANIDITIILQQPKIAPYIEQMRERVASILECCISSVSVKATTAEGLDAAGRGEAIAAQATVLLQNYLPK